jgi:hypothetical protein
VDFCGKKWSARPFGRRTCDTVALRDEGP